MYFVYLLLFFVLICTPCYSVEVYNDTNDISSERIVMFDNDSYNNASDPLVLAATASTFPETAAPGELRDDVRRILEVTTPLPLALRTREVDLGLDPDELGSAQAYAPKGKSAQANQLIQGAQAEIQYWSSPQRGVPSSPVGVEPTREVPINQSEVLESRGLPYAIDTDAAIAATRDPENSKAMRREYAWKQVQWSSLGTAISDIWDEWVHRNDEPLTKSEAEAYYKSRGLVVKETRDRISLYEAQKKADILIAKQEAESTYGPFFQTVNISFLEKVELVCVAIISLLFTSTGLIILTLILSLILICHIKNNFKILFNNNLKCQKSEDLDIDNLYKNDWLKKYL